MDTSDYEDGDDVSLVNNSVHHEEDDDDDFDFGLDAAHESSDSVQEDGEAGGVFDAEPVDSQTMSYFPPTVSTASFPSMPASQKTIFRFLLEAADVDAALYPPANWQQLQTIVNAIEEESRFDTLRRNALVYYLLLDYHHLPTIGFNSDATSTISSKTNGQKRRRRSAATVLLEKYCINRLLPDFWRDSVQRGFWRFDKGWYRDAIPFLTAENSAPYANHILSVLDPSKEAGNPAAASVKAQCVVNHLRFAQVVVDATQPFVLQAVAVAKALAVDLADSLAFSRSLPPQMAVPLLEYTWAWLFSFAGKERTRLLKSIIALPLTTYDIESLKSFVLNSNESASATSLALDTLIVRLFNSGKVVEALRTDAQAQESRGQEWSSADVVDGDASGNVKRRKKRAEMLRTAKSMLPSALRLELDEMSLEDRGGAVVDSTQQKMNIAKQQQEPADISLAATAATAANDSRALPGYRSNTPSRQAADSPFNRHTSAKLMSMSPFAGGRASSPGFSGNRGTPSASRAPAALQTGGTTFRPSASGSSNIKGGSLGASNLPTTNLTPNDGPYARLAAQLATRSHALAEEAAAAAANNAASTSRLAQDEDLPSDTFASLLPQKRQASTAAVATRESEDPTLPDEAVEEDRTESPSAFEIPKRRYVATKKPDRQKRTEAVKTSPTKRVGGRGQSKRLKSVEPVDGDGGDGQNHSVELQRPISSARMPASAQQEDADTTSMPGAWPGATADDDLATNNAVDEHREIDAVPEMEEISTFNSPMATRRSRSTRASARGSSLGPTTATSPTKRTSGAAGAASGGLPPASSTPLRRSTRAGSVRSRTGRSESVVSSQFDDDEDRHDDDDGAGSSGEDAGFGGGGGARGRGRITRSMSVQSSLAGDLDEGAGSQTPRKRGTGGSGVGGASTMTPGRVTRRSARNR